MSAGSAAALASAVEGWGSLARLGFPAAALAAAMAAATDSLAASRFAAVAATLLVMILPIRLVEA